jgi:hypothetical protein
MRGPVMDKAERARRTSELTKMTQNLPRAISCFICFPRMKFNMGKPNKLGANVGDIPHGMTRQSFGGLKTTRPLGCDEPKIQGPGAG